MDLFFELALILVSRVVEVSMGTLRIILINKGYRKIGVILAFFEVAIWVFVASKVLTGISEQPIKGVVYSIGFALGVYVGSKLETRLAFGQIMIQVITDVEKSLLIATSLRNLGLGVTVIDGTGKDDAKKILIVYANRKGQELIINNIRAIDEKAVIMASDISTLKGGYITSWRRFVK